MLREIDTCNTRDLGIKLSICIVDDDDVVILPKYCSIEKVSGVPSNRFHVHVNVTVKNDYISDLVTVAVEL